MGKLFGTDGIRGVVGETLTVELALKTGQAIASVLKEEKNRRPVIVIGKDTRISSDMLEQALIAGICSVGGDVIPLGVLPTPAVAYLTVKKHADAGIVISASHNPFEHNGIKVFNEQGYKLSDALEAKIETRILSQEESFPVTHDEIGLLHQGSAREEYIHHLAGTIQNDLSGLRILVDCANGAASTTASALFARFHCDADFIHCAPNGININENCGSTHLEDLSALVVEGKYDIGVAFDGDADRCLMVDEKGNVIDGDKIMAVCGSYLKNHDRLSGNTIVATVMSNLGLHEFCTSNNIELLCTNVGDRNVLEKMVEGGYVLGGEQSGHMIFTEYTTTGDGQLSALQFLQILSESGKTASLLTQSCVKYPQILSNIVLDKDKKDSVMASAALKNAIEQEERRMQGEGRILVRASGTENLIRVMAEAKTEAAAQAVVERLVKLIKTL